MSASQDGRLELDELGSVIDDAASLGDADDTLGDGGDAPSLGQRVAAGGLGAWAERHRGLVRGGAVVAALAGVAFLVRTATAPPPPSPDVVATVAPDLNAQEGGLALSSPGAGVLTSVWTVSGVRPGETVRVVGVDGPGVRASSARLVGTEVAGIRKWAVSGVLGCEGTDVTSDEPPGTATTPYSLQLERTDAWGRVATSAVPLPPGSEDWATLVGQVCWPEETALGIHVDALTVRADTARAVVTLGLDLSSSLDMPVLVGVAPDTQTTTETGRSFLAPLEARASTQLDATVRVTSCESAAPPQVMADPRVSGGRLLPGIPLEVQAARDSRSAIVPVVLDGPQTAQVQAAIDQVCTGAPDVSATVADVSDEAAVDGFASLRIAVQIRSSATGLALVRLSWDGVQLTSGRDSGLTELRGSGGTAQLRMLVPCSATPAPPLLSVVIDDDGRARPWSRILDDAPLEQAILDACDGLTPEMLVTSGWPRPAR